MARFGGPSDTQRLQHLIADADRGRIAAACNMARSAGNLMQRVALPYFRMLDAACNKRDPGSGCSAIEASTAGTRSWNKRQCVATHPSISPLAGPLGAHDEGADRRGSHVRGRDLYAAGDTPHLEHTLGPGTDCRGARAGRSHARRARYLKVRDRLFLRVRLRLEAAAVHIEPGVLGQARLRPAGVGTRPGAARLETAVARLRSAGFEARRSSRAGARPLAGNRYKVECCRGHVRALEMAAQTHERERDRKPLVRVDGREGDRRRPLRRRVQQRARPMR